MIVAVRLRFRRTEQALPGSSEGCCWCLRWLQAWVIAGGVGVRVARRRAYDDSLEGGGCSVEVDTLVQKCGHEQEEKRKNRSVGVK
mgnify:CR=1 FL=1